MATLKCASAAGSGPYNSTSTRNFTGSRLERSCVRLPQSTEALPRCGLTPDLDDVDFLYPVTRDCTVWGAHCSSAAGGCDASILGDSREDAMARWEARASDTPAPAGISPTYRKDIGPTVRELRRLCQGEPSRQANALEAMLAAVPLAPSTSA